MIIQCEQCRTKFKLDDAKVTERGVKVRCAKCRHVFTVRSPETAAPETPPTFSASPVAMADEMASMPTAPSVAPAFDTNEISFADVGTDETPLGQTSAVPPHQEPETAPLGLDFGTVLPQASDVDSSSEINFDFGEARPTTAAPQNISFDFTTKPTAVAAAPTGDVDFGSFDFGDINVAKPDDSFSLDGADFGGLAAERQTDTSASDDLGFSFSDVEPQANTHPADGFEISNLDFGSAHAAPNTPTNNNGNLDEFEFGTDATSVAVPASADQNEALFSFSQEQEPIPAAAAAAQPVTEELTAEAPHYEETPPLSITSRRRQSPIVSALIVAACLLLVGALGFMGYLFLGDSSSAHKFFGRPAPAEEGKIVVQKVQAIFLTKAAAGDLLVITGEALNSFSKPRAALQLKATLFGANNEQLVTQTAYAGNQLTHEQLISMPKEKIEAAMNNQFGDSLTNLGVPAGKTIPFSLVIINPPATAKDFGVEAVGSTIAASK